MQLIWMNACGLVLVILSCLCVHSSITAEENNPPSIKAVAELEIKELSIAITEQPDDPVNLTRRARLLWLTGQRGPAVVDLDNARRLDAYLADVTQAELLGMAGDRKKSEQMFSTLISNLPLRHEAYYARAFVRLKDNDKELALKDFDSTIFAIKDKQSHEYYSCLCTRADLLLEMGRYAESIRNVDMAIAWNKDAMSQLSADGIDIAKNPHLFYVRGLARARLGEYEKAIADFTKCETYGARWAAIYSARADCYRKIGDTTKEREDVKRAIVADQHQ